MRFTDRINVPISPELREVIEVEARKREMTMAGLVRQATLLFLGRVSCLNDTRGADTEVKHDNE